MKRTKADITMKAKLLLLTLTAGLGFGASAQGFLNMNFERAVVQVNDTTYGSLDWSLAVPGWGHSAGGDTSAVYYRSEHLGLSQYYLLMDSTSPTYAPGTQLAGAYSLAFASGIQNGADINSPWVNALISQTGTIPVGTHSVQLLAKGPFDVFVGGAGIPMYSLGANLHGGDVSAFAGSTVELKIVNTAPVGSVHNPTIVDNILFSPTTVPEPSSLGLLATGAVLILGWTRRRAGQPSGRS